MVAINILNDNDKKTLTELAKNCQIAEKRLEAVEKLTDLDALTSIACHSKYKDTKIKAMNILTSRVNEITTPSILMHVALYFRNKKARKVALKKITNPKTLELLAIYSKYKDVRLNVINNITDLWTLAKIVMYSKYENTKKVALHKLEILEKIQNINDEQKLLGCWWDDDNDDVLHEEIGNKLASILSELKTQDALWTVAQCAKDEKSRKIAVNKITDQESLSMLARDSKPDIKKIAINMLISNFQESTDYFILYLLAKHSKDKMVRRVALEKLINQPVSLIDTDHKKSLLSEIIRVSKDKNIKMIAKNEFKKLKCSGCRVIIFKDNKILLLRRKKYGEEYYVLPGSTTKQGKNIWYGLAQKIRKETGIQINNFYLIKKLEEVINDKKRQVYIFLVRSYSEDLELGSLEKNLQRKDNKYLLEWHPLDSLDKLLLYPEGIKEIIANVYNKLK